MSRARTIPGLTQCVNRKVVEVNIVSKELQGLCDGSHVGLDDLWSMPKAARTTTIPE